MKAPAPSTACALALALALAGCDTVRITNSSGDEHGLLLDGFTEGVHRNDKIFTSNEPEIAVGVIGASRVNNELIGFTNRRPVALRLATPWTASADTIDLAFAEEIAIPVTVWIVRGPFANQRDRAIDASLTTTAIWSGERMGVRFAEFQILDATENPASPEYSAFQCARREALEADIGRVEGRINIYYVDTVSGGSGTGSACEIGGDFVAMGRATGDELLSHELGHNFSLTHINSLRSSFDQTNVMHRASNRRAFLTEGQVFRAHLGFDSAINAVYDARAGLPTRNCDRDEATPFCPRIALRIFPDGFFRDPEIPPVIGAPAPADADDDVLELARSWLSTSCFTGEERGLPEALIEDASRVEPLLLDMLEQGPGVEPMSSFEQDARTRYRSRASLLATREDLGLSPADLESARGTSEEQFLERARRDFELRYRSQAAFALGILGSDHAAAALRSYAENPDSPLQSSARQALEAWSRRAGET